MTAPGPISYADRAPTRIAPSDWASKSSEGERRASPTSRDAYGVAAVAVVHGAALEPSLMLGAAFAFFILEFGFVMLTVLLSQVGLGELAWVRILGGNVVGAVLTFVMLSRRHPLRQELKQAAADDE